MVGLLKKFRNYEKLQIDFKGLSKRWGFKQL